MIAEGPAKPNLVVVRAGASSLHQGWLDIPYAERSWDLIVSYFDEAAFDAHQNAAGVSKVLVKGGKWNGLFKTLVNERAHTGYAHVWLPDDDIATTGTAINQLFDEAKAHNLAVCQPALTPDSYFSHFLFLQCSAFTVRFTNYIEIMVPCLSADLLAEALPLFENTMSGYGLDYVWCRLPAAGPRRAAILDRVAVHHTRPVGSALRSKIAEATGATSEDEEQSLVAQFGNIPRTVPLAYGGLTDDGDLVEGRMAMAMRMSAHYWKNARNFRDPSLARRKTLQLFKRQLIKQMSLQPLNEPRFMREVA